MLLSIALCTWNRADRLAAALASFKSLHRPEGWDWDVLVVDNNSTDATPRVVQTFADALPIRCVFERRQGLSHARNRALREVRGDLVIFTDDDIVADPKWLTEYAAAVAAYPGAAFFGGTIDVRFASRPPRWLTANFDHFASAYALRRIDPGIRAVLSREDLPYGANMAFRRGALAEAGLFAPELGRNGTNLMGGEELEYMERLLARGGEGIWVGPARVEHVIGKDRLSRSYIHDYFVWQGRAQMRMEPLAIDPVAERRLRKKTLRARRKLRFALRKDAAWADAFIWWAMQEGRLEELAARRAGGSA